MSRLFVPTLVLHVVVAVMGLGTIVSVPIVAAAARRNRQNTKEIFSWLSPLLRLSAVSLAVMLVTGILLDFAAQGGFRHSWWFRGSALLLLVTAALHDLAVFESHRAPLVAHAYRMLGGLGRAEDMVQEAWLRWDGRREEVDSRVHIW